MATGATWENLEFYLKRRVHIYNGHWIWCRSLYKDGYGQLRIGSVLYRAHRVAYIKFVGPIPEDKPYVLHKPECHTRRCINPEHLYCGTHRDNMDDRGFKFELDIIQQIRIRALKGETHRSIAYSLGVSKTYVGSIIHNQYRI